MIREIENEEQSIQPRIKANNDNNIVEEVVYEEYDKYTEEIHLIQYKNDSIHLTQICYEESLNLRKLGPSNHPNKGSLSLA